MLFPRALPPPGAARGISYWDPSVAFMSPVVLLSLHFSPSHFCVGMHGYLCALLSAPSLVRARFAVRGFGYLPVSDADARQDSCVIGHLPRPLVSPKQQARGWMTVVVMMRVDARCCRRPRQGSQQARPSLAHISNNRCVCAVRLALCFFYKTTGVAQTQS